MSTAPLKKSGPDRPVKVTVLVMTYNHCSFVAQALDSALEQQTSFEYEILVSEDCSTDGTRELVVDYQRRYPQTIRLLLSEKNIRSNAIVVRGIRAARGEYIALLDGDDYWTSPRKLQKQADFLDSHPACAICFHNARTVKEGGNGQSRNWTPAGHPEISTLEDIWMGNFIATCSTMFRNGLVRPIPAWYDGMFPITDWPLHILNAEHGSIGYIDEVMGVYRQHQGGYYSPLNEAQKQAKTLAFYREMNAHLDYRYDTIVRTAISKYFYDWAREYIKQGRFDRARACFNICLTGRPLNRHMSPRKLLKMGARLYLSKLSPVGRAGI